MSHTGDRAVTSHPSGEESIIDKDAIIVIAQATALPGNEAALRAAIDEVIPPSLAEAGVEVFRLHEDIEKSDHFVLYERFANQAALDSHFASSHFKWSTRSRPWWPAESRISRGCDS